MPRRLQRLRQHQRAAPFVGGKMGVAAGQGEPVIIPHGRAAVDFRADVQIGCHALDDGQLLPVLLAKHRRIGLCGTQQLRHHGRHAVEMPRPYPAAQQIRQAAHPHEAGKARRIHGGDIGGVKQTAPCARELHGIAGFITRIAGKILVGAELLGIHEDRSDHDIGQCEAFRHQCQMASVQRAHGRHEGDTLARGLPGPHLGAQFCGRSQGGQCVGHAVFTKEHPQGALTGWRRCGRYGTTVQARTRDNRDCSCDRARQ